jgi:hypothetical protein
MLSLKTWLCIGYYAKVAHVHQLLGKPVVSTDMYFNRANIEYCQHYQEPTPHAIYPVQFAANPSTSAEQFHLAY